MNYSKQLIEDFEKNLDERLVSFHKKNEEIYLFKPLKGCIEDTLNMFLNDTTHRDNIHEITMTQKKIYRNKKARLIKKVQDDNKKYKITDEKNPFYFLVQQKGLLIEEQWNMLYGNKTMDDIVEEFLQRIADWKKEKDSLLIEYPLFASLTEKNKKKSFYHDVFLNLMKILKEKMNGNLDEFYKPTPTFMTETPVFANAKMNILMESNNGGGFEYTFDNEDLGYQLTISSNGESELRMLDEIDNTILNCIINHIDKDFYQSRTVHLTTGMLARAIYPNKKPGTAHYKTVKKRLKNMLYLHYDYKDEKRDATFNIFDNVVFERPDIDDNVVDVEKIDIMLGSLLYESIVEKKMVYVTSNNYDALENQLSKLLYYTLQKERIKLSTQLEEDQEVTGQYDYIFFSKSIMFKEKKKNKNIKLIKDSLAEFVDKQIAVKSFELKKDVFYISFIPLSESERADLISTNLA